MIKAIRLSVSASIFFTLGLLSPFFFAQNFDNYISSVGQTTVAVDAGATMIFDGVSEVRYHHDRELLNIVAGN